MPTPPAPDTQEAMRRTWATYDAAHEQLAAAPRERLLERAERMPGHRE